MHKLVLKIHEYLEKAASGKIEVDDKLLDEFGERVKEKLKKQLSERKEFRLRMSNIGRPVRQLMLEQKYGAGKPDADFMLKMLFGDLYESLMIYLIKASGCNIVEQDTPVSLPISTAKGTVNLEGMLDLVLDFGNGPGVYDVKSCSPWAYVNKFDGTSLINGEDTFGYVDQLFGYAKCKDIPAKGWIPINKVDGQFKVDEIPNDQQNILMEKSVKTIEDKVRYITEGNPIPECTGVEDELFYGKKTGKRILGNSCKFCQCKERCHPGIQYKPSTAGKAKNPEWKWYVKE